MLVTSGRQERMARSVSSSAYGIKFNAMMLDRDWSLRLFALLCLAAEAEQRIVCRRLKQVGKQGSRVAGIRHLCNSASQMKSFKVQVPSYLQLRPTGGNLRRIPNTFKHTLILWTDSPNKLSIYSISQIRTAATQSRVTSTALTASNSSNLCLPQRRRQFHSIYIISRPQRPIHQTHDSKSIHWLAFLSIELEFMSTIIFFDSKWRMLLLIGFTRRWINRPLVDFGIAASEKSEESKG